ncbi:MAG: DUF3604 domain-containing protein [Chlamydiota bacterium]
MRRTICYCEPNVAVAGEIATRKFIYSAGTALPKGTKLKFDILSSGREADWEVPSANLKKKRNVIYALHQDKVLSAKEVEVPDSIVPQFEFTLPSELKAGQDFTIIIGSPEQDQQPDASQEIGNGAQNHSQRRRPFHLYIDPTGKGHYGEPEIITIDVKGSELSSIRILAPSFVSKNKRFDVVVRFEDEYGNLTHNTPEDTLIELTYEHLRENLNWKLFVPETGFINLPNLYFNEEGIYRIQLRNVNTGDVFYSWPIKCFLDNDHHLFWGTLHGESERYDSDENVESCLRYFRDDQSLNFYATSNFESAEETPNDIWKSISQNVVDFNEDERFTSLLGMQWSGEAGKEGVRQIIYSGDNKPLLRKKETKFNSLRKIYKQFAPNEILSIPSFTMAQGYHYDFEHYNPDFERVAEIYNSWGSSECPVEEENTVPITSENGQGISETSEGAIQTALQNNCRLGFVAGGLDDRGIYSDCYDNGQEQYPAGLTAVMAPEQSRAAIFKALQDRSCYATTGERILIGFNIVGQEMGSEISTKDKPGLKINRHISGFAACTDKLLLVEIIRNGKVIKIFEPENTSSFDFTFDDMTELSTVTLDGGKGRSPFAYYYIRIMQEDGHMAWSSPIWIDLES